MSPLKMFTKETDWAEHVKRFIKAELKRKDVTYAVLAERLAKYGFKESAPSLANKLRRGKFSATFFFAVMAAIGVEEIRLQDL